MLCSSANIEVLYFQPEEKCFYNVLRYMHAHLQAKFLLMKDLLLLNNYERDLTIIVTPGDMNINNFVIVKFVCH